MERISFRLFIVFAAGLHLNGVAAASDVQSLVQKGLHTKPEIPPLVPNAEVPLRPPKIDSEWLDEFQDTFKPLICHIKQEDCDVRFKSADPGGSTDFDMSSMMKYLQMLFTAVKSEDFMGNMSMLNDGIRAISHDLKKNSLAHLDGFLKAAEALDVMDQVVPLLARLFDDQMNTTSQYSTSMTDLSYRVLDSMPADMADGLRPMLKMIQSTTSTALNVRLSDNSSVAEVCDLGDDFFYNLTEGLKTVRKMRKMSNSTQKMLPMITDYLTSMRPQVAPRVVFLIEQFSETSYIGSTDWIELMQAINAKVKPVFLEKLKCTLPKSGASTASLGLLAALLSFAASWLLH